MGRAQAPIRGLRYVHSANEPLLIAGVGAYALEIFEDIADPDVILVPIGGGSGASGCCIVRTGLGRKTRVIGVQAAEADAFTRSWRGPERVSADRTSTFAEGLATRFSFDLTFGILKRELDEIVTLTEFELEEGVRLALRATHNLAEGAGAASLAAAMKLRERLHGKKVVAVMTGGNITTEVMRRHTRGPSLRVAGVIVLPYSQETRIMYRSVVSALGFGRSDRLARGRTSSGGRRPAGRRGSASADEEPASATERHAAAAGRRDHAGVDAALGVECGHCHIWTKPGDPSNDMAADTKIEKTVARVMMQMTNENNAKLAASIKKPADQIARVECATCHRGVAIPVTPPPPPPPARDGARHQHPRLRPRSNYTRTARIISRSRPWAWMILAGSASIPNLYVDSE